MPRVIISHVKAFLIL